MTISTIWKQFVLFLGKHNDYLYRWWFSLSFVQPPKNSPTKISWKPCFYWTPSLPEYLCYTDDDFLPLCDVDTFLANPSSPSLIPSLINNCSPSLPKKTENVSSSEINPLSLPEVPYSPQNSPLPSSTNMENPSTSGIDLLSLLEIPYSSQDSPYLKTLPENPSSFAHGSPHKHYSNTISLVNLLFSYLNTLYNK